MRMPTTPAFLLLLLCCGEPVDPAAREWMPDQDSPPGKLVTTEQGVPATTIVFYNTENLFDTHDDPGTGDDDFTPDGKLNWTDLRLETKLNRIGEAIHMADAEWPALVGLCEVENAGVVNELARNVELFGAHYAVVHHDSPDERGIDVALLYRERLFTLLASEALNVPLKDDRTRDILHATLASDPDTFHVFVNHWPSRREGQEKSEPKRMIAASVLAKAIEGIRTGPNMHVLVMGDFNDTPMDRSIQEGLGAGCTRTSPLVDLMCLDQPEDHGSHQYNGHWDYLDQFIVDRDLAKRVASAKALWDERLLFKHPRSGLSPNKTYSGTSYKGGYSDHLPVVLRLE